MNIKRALFPILALAAFAVVAVVIVRTTKRPQPETRTELGALVEVAEVSRASYRIDVHAQGTVMPARQVVLQPQVSGRVEWIAAALEPGGRVAAGAPLFRIEKVDYELAVASARSALAETKAQLALEQGRGRVAEREWELFRDEVDAEQRAATLALREPQLRSAEAAVASARARLAQAELNLERTTVRSPWNALVLDESVEVGQAVSPQSAVATLVGADLFWVRTSVPTDQLAAIALGSGADGSGASRAWVRLDGFGAVERPGRVARLLGDVDPAGRMARVLVEVADPLRAPEALGDAGRLLLDSYVDVRIEGANDRELFELPRDWLQDGREVWLYEDGLLAVREVEVVWRSEDVVYVDQGLRDGDQVVTSRIATPIPGMKLRRLGDPQDPPSKDGAPLRVTAADDTASVEVPAGGGEGLGSQVAP
jgi:RND family efflux transporter MFP subunit